MSDSVASSDPRQTDPAQDQRPGNAASALVTTSVADLVDGANALAAYHGFIEASVYQSSLKSARAARDFHGELIGRAQVLLTFADDENGKTSIDADVRAANAKLASSVRPDRVGITSAFERARRLDSDGFALLDIREPFDIAALKSAYRGAAKRHHPDIGGDTATMQRVNDAYGLFFAALHEDAIAAARIDSNQPRESAPQSAADIMIEARRAIFLAAVDDFAADTAFAILSKLALPTSSSLDSSLFDPVLRLAQLLSAMGHLNDARTVLALGEREFARLTARGLNFAHAFARAALIVAQPKTLRLVINHQRQADNALRLGLIDRARYGQTITRLNRNIAEDAAQQASVEVALGAVNFRRLPLDPGGPLALPIGLVPMPGYYATLESLEPAQVEEYKRAFFGHDARLIVKYLFVRLTALFKAVVAGYDLISAIDEAHLIRDAALPKTSAEYYAGELCSLFKCFEQEGAKDRNERFAILRKLDKDGSGMSLRIGSTQYSARISVPKPISLSPAYFQFARQSLAQLRNSG